MSEDKADQAASIMDRFEAVGKDTSASVPVVEEQLLGKAKLATGGVRVTSSVEELPVEETVTLRDERVSASSGPADRELTAEEAEAAFEEDRRGDRHHRRGEGQQAGSCRRRSGRR